jgi:ATP-dependent Clp protease ATP-binding subunit ClpA
MLERFTDETRQVLVFAHDEAKALEHGRVGTEHLLLGAIEASSAIAAGLESLGASLDALVGRIEEAADPERRRTSGPRPYTPRAKQMLEAANDVATDLGHERVQPEHLVLALVEGEDVASNLLAALGAAPEAVRATMIALLAEGTGTVPEPIGESDYVASAATPAADEEPHLNGKDVGAAATIEEQPERTPGVPPACPRCDANLVETMRWRQHVALGADDEPLMVYLVYCGDCGRTLEVRAEV